MENVRISLMLRGDYRRDLAMNLRIWSERLRGQVW